MNTFNLPDLGEGLPDAEIVEWLVAEGDTVKVDDPIVSMETAKAVVEVPSPYAGKVARLHGQAGDVIKTGAPLIDFDTGEGAGDEPSDDQAAEPDASEQTSEQKLEPQAVEPADDDAGQTGEERADTGTVVGNVTTSDEVVKQTHSSVGGVKVTPAVRALARKLKVDLGSVEATGPEGVVTSSDVRKAAEQGPTREPATGKPAQEPARPEPPKGDDDGRSGSTQNAPAAEPPSGDWEPMRGTRRTMARAMSASHARVVATTIMDDADIHGWQRGEDITVRRLRSLWAGAQSEPS